MQGLTDEQRDKIEQEQSRFDALTHKVFRQNKDGAAWLAEVKESLLVKQKTADPNKPEAFAFYREGQNDWVRMVLQSINSAEARAKSDKGGD